MNGSGERDLGPDVRLAHDGAVAVLSWSRPSRRNALDRATLAALAAALAALSRRPPAALVLAGEGGDFSAGADLTDVRALCGATRAEALAYSRFVQGLADAVERLPVPTVAAIEGVCLGLGLELALAAGVRVAAAGARLGLPEIRHGLYPAAGGTARLGEHVGEGRARLWLIEGRVVDAAVAERAGLVDRVLADGEARTAAIAWAAELAGAGEAVVRLLAARRAGRGAAFDAALEAERQGFADLVRSEDVKRRLDAFFARRRKGRDGDAVGAGAGAGAGPIGLSGEGANGWA
jgi:enoyl-CoA hydratase